MRLDESSAGRDEGAPAVAGVRTILVPPGIVAVPRTSPVRVRKRTPWRPQPDGQMATPRTGQREWFSDRLFVETHDGHTRSGYGTSLFVHLFAGVALLGFLIARPDPPLVVRTGLALVMPAIVSPLPTMPVVEAPVAKATVQTRSEPSTVAPPPAAVSAPAAPVDAPSGIVPETGAENGVAGAEGGAADGIAGGVVGGVGSAAAPAGPAGPSVVQVGAGIKRPRKIKDVMPVYPQSALLTRPQGAVLIEAVIGTNGKVQELKVLHSVPSLDQAALDAVCRWEYEPSFLNGVPVAVIMIIVVNFALQ